MPHPTAFLGGFGFKSTARKNGWSLKVKRATHIEVEKFRTYRFDFELVLVPSQSQHASNTSLISSLRSAASRKPIVKSQYGNPYACRITSFDPDNTSAGVRIRMKGEAKRIFK